MPGKKYRVKLTDEEWEHEALCMKYPFHPTVHVPFDGITNLRPESKTFQERVRELMKMQE